MKEQILFNFNDFLKSYIQKITIEAVSYPNFILFMKTLQVLIDARFHQVAIELADERHQEEVEDNTLDHIQACPEQDSLLEFVDNTPMAMAASTTTKLHNAFQHFEEPLNSSAVDR